MKRKKKRTADVEIEVLPNGVILYHHHRDPNATLESLRALSGIIHLAGSEPMPSWGFLEDEEPGPPWADVDDSPDCEDEMRGA